jgi:hypothetical protein
MIAYAPVVICLFPSCFLLLLIFLYLSIYLACSIVCLLACLILVCWFLHRINLRFQMLIQWFIFRNLDSYLGGEKMFVEETSGLDG